MIGIWTFLEWTFMVYLDNAATTWPKPEMVYSTLYSFMKNSCANPGRSAHKMARISSSLVLKTREALSELFYIQNPLDIAFTANATQALNLAIQGVLRQGDHVVTTAMEHIGAMLSIILAEGIIDYSVVMPYDSYGNVPSSIAEAIRPNTRLIALSSASNVTGTFPYEEVGEIVEQKKYCFSGCRPGTGF